MRRAFKPSRLPVYLDGELEIFEVKNIESNNFFKDVLKSTGEKICFERLSVYDRVRLEAKSRGIELTLKLRLPPTDFERLVYVKINGAFHTVENATNIIDQRDGFLKTELTLSKYNESYEVIE